MKLSQEFCEMIKVAYEDEIHKADFYAKLAEMVQDDDIHQKLSEMGNESMKNSLYLNSIHGNAANDIKTSNGNGGSGYNAYMTPYMMPVPQIPSYMPYYEDTTMPELMDMIPATPFIGVPAADQLAMPFSNQPMMNMPNCSMCPPCNQTVNIFPPSHMEHNFMMPNMNVPIGHDYGTFSMPMPGEMPEEYKGIYDIPASPAPENCDTFEAPLTSIPDGAIGIPIPSILDYIVVPTPSEEDDSCCKKICSSDDTFSSEDDVNAQKKPSSIPIPKSKTSSEKPVQTNSKGNSKNNMLKNAFKDNKRG